jgi:hypothetical protein
LDADALVGCFADAFMAADPSGAQPVPLAGFLSVLPRRKQCSPPAAGVGRASLTNLTYSNLDEHYLLVHTTWRAERQGGSAGHHSVTLRSTFILRHTEDGLRIVFYLNHQDLAEMLADEETSVR